MRRAGFTMLEVLIAGAVGLVIVTAALAFLVASDRAHQRRVRLAELRRSAARVSDQLGAELRQAGLGVPSGSAVGGGAFASRRLVLATATSLGFVADLPRPDSSFSGLSQLVDDQLTNMPADAVALTNAQSGACDVSLGAVHCETGLATRLFAPAAGGCHLAGTDATCPWALNRLRAGDWVQIADARGRWLERRVAAGVFADSASRRALALAPSGLPAAFAATAAGGQLATLDRVFYRDNAAGLLERHQCWDTVGAATVAALGPCVGGAGTPWEPVLPLPPNNTVTFSYADATGAALAVPVTAANLPRVARVDIALHLERTFGPEVLTLDATNSVAFRQ